MLKINHKQFLKKINIFFDSTLPPSGQTFHRSQQRQRGWQGVHLLHVPGRGPAHNEGGRVYPPSERRVPPLHVRHGHREHHARVRRGAADHDEAEPRQVHERFISGDFRV